MTLHIAFGIKYGDADAIDYRLGLAGLVGRDASRVPRYGVFPPGVSGAGRADMSIDVSPFVAAVGRGSSYGVVLVANDGTVASPTFDAAPSSNSRIDVLWVRQNDSVDAADADNLPVFGIAKGTAAASPTQPAVPSGALPLLAVLFPALVGATNAAGVTITQAASNTGAAGSVFRARDSSDIGSVYQGQMVFREDLGAAQRYFNVYNATTNPGGRVAAGWYTEGGEFNTQAVAVPNYTLPASTAMTDVPGTAISIPPAPFDRWVDIHWGASVEFLVATTVYPVLTTGTAAGSTEQDRNTTRGSVNDRIPAFMTTRISLPASTTAYTYKMRVISSAASAGNFLQCRLSARVFPKNPGEA